MAARGAWIMSLALWACSSEEPSRSVDYENLVVPTNQLASEEARQRGHELFLRKCALCHGVKADGKGVRRQGLSGPPANFQRKEWRRQTSPRRVYAVLREGVQGTSMPAWPTFSDEETWDVVAYVLSVSETPQ